MTNPAAHAEFDIHGNTVVVHSMWIRDDLREAYHLASKKENGVEYRVWSENSPYLFNYSDISVTLYLPGSNRDRDENAAMIDCEGKRFTTQEVVENLQSLLAEINEKHGEVEEPVKKKLDIEAVAGGDEEFIFHVYTCHHRYETEEDAEEDAEILNSLIARHNAEVDGTFECENCKTLQEAIDYYEDVIKRDNDLKKSLPTGKRPTNPQEALRLCADWFGAYFPDEEDDYLEDDCRRFADELENAEVESKPEKTREEFHEEVEKVLDDIAEREEDRQKINDALANAGMQVNSEGRSFRPETADTPETIEVGGKRLRLRKILRSENDLCCATTDEEFVIETIELAIKNKNFAGFYFEWFDSDGAKHWFIADSPVKYRKGNDIYDYMPDDRCDEILRPTAVAFLEEV